MGVGDLVVVVQVLAVQAQGLHPAPGQVAGLAPVEGHGGGEHGFGHAVAGDDRGFVEVLFGEGVAEIGQSLQRYGFGSDVCLGRAVRSSSVSGVRRKRAVAVR